MLSVAGYLVVTEVVVIETQCKYQLKKFSTLMCKTEQICSNVNTKKKEFSQRGSRKILNKTDCNIKIKKS